jgi:hypothetical protein
MPKYAHICQVAAAFGAPSRMAINWGAAPSICLGRMALNVANKCGAIEANVWACPLSKGSPLTGDGANGKHGRIAQEHVEVASKRQSDIVTTSKELF